MEPIFILMGTSLIFVLAWMLILWSIYFFKGQITIIEWGWATSLIIIAFVCFIFGEGYLWRKMLVLLTLSISALRLIFQLMNRSLMNSNNQRYLYLASQMKYGSESFRILALFIVKGVLVVLLALPVYFIAQNMLPFFLPTEMFGLMIWGAGVVGQTIADRQLNEFQDNPLHRGMVCEEGLWNYSRHPNYFFEWIVWIGYAVMAFSSEFGWLGLLSPVLFIVLLFKGPYLSSLESQAIEKSGDAYRQYQGSTSIFFPWFKN